MQNILAWHLTNISLGKKHIHNICMSLGYTSFSRRNVNHFSAKFHCYKSFVRPMLEYASPIWAPYLQSDICAIVKIQHTGNSSAARYIYNERLLNDMEK